MDIPGISTEFLGVLLLQVAEMVNLLKQNEEHWNPDKPFNG